MIYISGAISSDKNYKKKFAKAEKYLSKTYNGFVFNPVKATKKEFGKPEETEWHILMIYCIARLVCCDEIYMLKDWEKSHGACIEYLWAQKMGIKITYEV